MNRREFPQSLKAIIGVFLLIATAAGCGGGGGGGAAPQPEAPKTGLVVGAASGPIYDELVSAYHLSPGSGSESPDAFGLAIYDGNSLTSEEIATLPSTDSFLNAGKILIILNPSLDDLKALEGELGAAALVDTAAVAIFKTFFGKDGLQVATVVEFPDTIDEPIAAVEGSESMAAAPVDSSGLPDESGMRARAEQWRKHFEQIYLDTSRSKRAVASVASDKLAAAAADDGANASSPAADSPSPDLTRFLTSPDNSELAPTSPFWTVRQFRERRDVTFGVRSNAFLDPLNYQVIPKDGSIPRWEFACPYLPTSPRWAMKAPVTASETASITNIVNRLLQPTSGSGGPTFNHNIVVRQVIDSSPPATLPDPTIGAVTVTWCLAQFHPESNTWSCTAPNFFCGEFDETVPILSLLGFNAQIVSNLAWDPASAALLNVGGLRPLAANNVSTVSSSEVQKVGVDFSIQGSVDGELIPPHIGLGVGSPSINLDWIWAQARAINIKDWATQPNKEGAVAIHTLFAKGGPDNLDNLNTYLLPGLNPKPGVGVLTTDVNQLTDLQRSNIESRTETTWTTADGVLLPPGKASMTSTTTFTYGEVLTALSAVREIPPGNLPYGMVHTFTVPTTFEFDFAQPVLQAPKPATWSVDAELKTPANSQGFFTVDGTVTLNQPNILETTILLGGEIYNFGNTQPAPTVIKNLPTQITIPGGATSATFEFLARRIGSPYNLRVWAFQAQGQQVAFPLTVPAK